MTHLKQLEDLHLEYYNIPWGISTYRHLKNWESTLVGHGGRLTVNVKSKRMEPWVSTTRRTRSFGPEGHKQTEGSDPSSLKRDECLGSFEQLKTDESKNEEEFYLIIESLRKVLLDLWIRMKKILCFILRLYIECLKPFFTVNAVSSFCNYIITLKKIVLVLFLFLIFELFY